MIYLIGGPPKCGKTTLAKALSKTLGISWVSTDTLQCVVTPYISDNEYSKGFPASEQRGGSNDEKYEKYSAREIIDAYRTQAKSVFPAIEAYIECELSEGHDAIMEGYHIEPSLIRNLERRFPGMIRSYILVKTDRAKLLSDFHKGSSKNDWVIQRTHTSETYGKIADMISLYSKEISREAKDLGITVLNMDSDFDEKIQNLIEENT